MKTIEILKNDKKVIINRTKLSDGYNYYITLMVFQSFMNIGWIVYPYKQEHEIKSLKQAKEVAAAIIDAIISY